MKKETLAKIIKKDAPTLSPWAGRSMEELPESAKFRIAKLIRRGEFDGKIDWDELNSALPELERITPIHDFCDDAERGGDASHYYIFKDGSLYYANNAQDEVWADKSDFISELLHRRGEEYPADSAEGMLIASL